MGEKRKYDLGDRLLDYATRIIRVVETLPKSRVGNHVAAQLLRAGTSPLSNHAEAQAAESPDDFAHKLRISLKELRETQRWLLLCKKTPLVQNPASLDLLLAETDELIAIFVTSIRTTERKTAVRTQEQKMRRPPGAPTAV